MNSFLEWTRKKSVYYHQKTLMVVHSTNTVNAFDGKPKIMIKTQPQIAAITKPSISPPPRPSPSPPPPSPSPSFRLRPSPSSSPSPILLPLPSLFAALAKGAPPIRSRLAHLRRPPGNSSHCEYSTLTSLSLLIFKFDFLV